ncbi:MAG TPA: protein kinase [Geothrix sp.]|nr:protein kinase [Geothrix sp.]
MTRVKWQHSLAWRFFFRTAIAILLLMGVVLGVTYDQAQKGAKDAAERGLLTASRVLDKNIPQITRVMDAGLEVFVSYSGHTSYIDAAQQKGDAMSVRHTLLDELANLQSDIAIVVRPSGELLSCTTDGARQDYQDVGIVQMALDPDGAREAGFPGPMYAGFLQIPGGAYKGFYLAVARPLRLPDGVIIGAMLVGTRLNDQEATDLRDMAAGKARPAPQLALLSMGNIVASTLDPALRTTLGEIFSARERYAGIQATLKEGQPSAFLPLRLGHTDYLACVNPLRGVDGPRFELATALLLPLDPYLAPFRKLQWTILATGALGLLAALAVALQSARGVTAPLARLLEATAELTEGGRPDLAPSTQKDEVGALTMAFSSLLSELKAKDDLLAALEPLRPQSGASEPPSRMGLTVIDMEATVLVPAGTPSPSGDAPATLRSRRITLKEGDEFAGRYRIESLLGMGGMGMVLKAHDQQLDEEVAIKVIRPELGVDAAYLDQLKQEIKLARRITHRHVLRTHDFGEADGIPFVTMEYLKGVTLKQLLDDRGRLPLPMVLRIGRQIAEGLEAAHAEGVVHRDIKPLNVLFDTRGDAKIMDFGLASPVSGHGTTADGQIFGTPRYMAPEQVQGAKADPRTDLYALGIMLFELAIGQPPFEDASLTELLRKQVMAPPPNPRSLAPDLPPAFASLLLRLLAKKMDDRPATATEVVEALKAVASP